MAVLRAVLVIAGDEGVKRGGVLDRRPFWKARSPNGPILGPTVVTIVTLIVVHSMASGMPPWI